MNLSIITSPRLNQTNDFKREAAQAYTSYASKAEPYKNHLDHLKMGLSIKFTKMHGLGNDFIFVDKTDLPVGFPINKMVSSVSKRHTGIGCDQFILYEGKNSYIDMEIFNADGSSAKACGNATRCLAYLFGTKNNTKEVTVNVNGRKLLCKLNNGTNVSVNMGIARFDEDWMPAYEKLAKELSQYLSANVEFLCVDIGNPHLVIIDQNFSNEDMALLGAKFEKSPLFKFGANINFATISDNVINLKVWERGAGFTYACGSGACASFAAGHKLGFVADSAKVKFELGVLEMDFLKEGILMSGPVSLVASGIFYYE